MKNLATLSFLLSATVGATLASCNSTPAKPLDGNASAETSLSEEEKQKIREYEAELDIGRNMAGRLLQYYKSFDDKEALEYVNLVGQLVAKNSPFAERKFVFGILDTDTVNAFAAPGGYILVTRGALKNVENEAELAGILGHEISHVGRKHIYDALLKKASQNADGTEGSGGNDKTPAAVRARKRPESDSNETVKTLAKYIGGSAGGQFNVLNAIQGGISLLLEEGIDPKLENEADLDGVKFAMAAGYDPRALENYFHRILKQKAALNIKVLGKTHPSIDSRIENIEAMVQKMVPKEYAGALGKERYDEKTKGI